MNLPSVGVDVQDVNEVDFNLIHPFLIVHVLWGYGLPPWKAMLCFANLPAESVHGVPGLAVHMGL